MWVLILFGSGIIALGSIFQSSDMDSAKVEKDVRKKMRKTISFICMGVAIIAGAIGYWIAINHPI